MEFTGKITNITRDWMTDQYQITFSVNESAAIKEVDKIKDKEKLTIKAVPFRKKRSLDANGMLWACLGEIAAKLRADKWDIYLQMLKRYGKFTFIVVRPNVVDAMKAQWRECEVVGDIKVNGQDAVQMLCYFGSSTYNTEEFSVLLDGVISEMEEMGLQPPPSQEMRRVLEEMAKNEKRTTS